MTSKKLTLKDKLICAFGRPEGYKAVFEFCEDIQEGRNPDPEFLEQLATAFKLLMKENNLRDGMSSFEKELNLQGKAGRMTLAGEEDMRIVAALEFLQLKKEYKEENKPRGAEIAADEVMRRYNIKSPTTLSNWAKKYSKEIANLESMIKIAETNHKKRNTKIA